MEDRVLVLDAMGVIFQAADDVAELLVPFVREHGGIQDEVAVGEFYRRASVDEITAKEFWDAVELSPTLQDDYLSRHRLTDGLTDFLADLPTCIDSLWCLSNDVSEWSHELRERHSLTDHFDGFVISADVGVRKPDVRIYNLLLDAVGCPAARCIFVDDRTKNLDAATKLGFQTVQFCESTETEPDRSHRIVSSFAQLAEYLKDIG